MDRPNIDQYFALFSCVQVVSGHKGAILCDMQRSVYTPVDKDLADFLQVSSKYKIRQIVQRIGEEKTEQVLAFLDQLVQSELGFYTDEPRRFPPISLEWKSPLPITHAILYVKHPAGMPYEEVLGALDQLGCNALQIQLDPEANLAVLEEILTLTQRSRIKSIELIVPQNILPGTYIHNLINKYLRITLLVVSGAPAASDFSYRGALVKMVESIDSIKHCGCVSPDYFNLNILSYTEALHFNSCLNRKIAIDAEGDIRNCPSMPESFGNIRNTTLQDALAHPDFKKYWNITKDQVAVCRDCEFRYICTDCRAYVEEPGNAYSKPLKCGYNPYTCEWEEWSTHPLKQRAIDAYGMREILPEFQLKADYVPVPKKRVRVGAAV